jgi:hypothetical protein
MFIARNMTRTSLLLLTVALLLPLSGCGNSDKQREAVSGKAGTAKDTPEICSPIMVAGLVKQCAVNNHDSAIDVTIDSMDDEVARNICAEIVDMTTRLSTHFAGRWKLRVFSPYRKDKELAACILR